MKRNDFIWASGPYKVSSMSQGGGGVRIVIYPAFPQYGGDWAITRERAEGGGPNIFTCMALATAFEEFLNQSYPQQVVAEWKETLGRALEKHDKLTQKRLDKALGKAERQHQKK
jgi:hypothetical protein